MLLLRNKKTNSCMPVDVRFVLLFRFLGRSRLLTSTILWLTFQPSLTPRRVRSRFFCGYELESRYNGGGDVKGHGGSGSCAAAVQHHYLGVAILDPDAEKGVGPRRLGYGGYHCKCCQLVLERLNGSVDTKKKPVWLVSQVGLVGMAWSGVGQLDETLTPEQQANSYFVSCESCVR